MKNLGFMIVMLSLACTPQQEQKAEVPESSALKELVRGADVGLTLNDGEKWVLDSASLNKLYVMRNKVSNMGFNLENVQVGQLNRFGVDLQAHIDSMPKTLGEHRHPQVELLLESCEQQIEILEGKDLPKAQTALVSLSYILDEVNNYFTYPENTH